MTTPDSPDQIKEEFCRYLTGTAEAFRALVDRDGDQFPEELRAELEFLEGFCRFAVSAFEHLVGKRILSRLRREHARTGNPYLAWMAFRLAHSWHLPVPDWTLAYLDGAARRLLTTEDWNGRGQAVIAGALGLAGEVGTATAWSSFRTFAHTRLISRVVDDKLKELLAVAQNGAADEEAPFEAVRRSAFFAVAAALDLIVDEDLGTADGAADGDDEDNKEDEVLRYIRDRYAAYLETA